MSDTRTKILASAARLVLREGISRLTIADAAKEAGISRGGLLYHFPSKEDLISAMLVEALHNFDKTTDRAAAEDKHPGAWTRAYVKACFPDSNREEMAAALLVSLTGNRDFSAEYAQRQRKWTDRLHHDGIDLRLAEIIRLAADGLWFN